MITIVVIYIGNVTIYEYVNIGTNSGKSAIIGDYAIINSCVCVVEPINIGADAVIVAESVVTKDIELFVITGGNPTRKIETK